METNWTKVIEAARPAEKPIAPIRSQAAEAIQKMGLHPQPLTMPGFSREDAAQQIGVWERYRQFADELGGTVIQTAGTVAWATAVLTNRTNPAAVRGLAHHMGMAEKSPSEIVANAELLLGAVWAKRPEMDD